MIPEYADCLFTPGHRACPGCGASIAVRAVLAATGPEVIVVTPTGCLEAFSTPYPYAPWGVPWIHPLFENGPAVATGVAAALKRRGLAGKVKVVVIGGDGSTYDIGFGSLSGMLERGDDVTYVCYDNEAYMNTGVQRSSSTPFAASTMTSPAGSRSWGKDQPKKNLTAIALAHNIPYVANCSIGYPQDISRKVKTALGCLGAKFINIHAPCPIGWGFDTARTIDVAKLAVQTGLVPIYEAGLDRPLKVRKLVKRKPVEAYLKVQNRFKHLFEDGGQEFIAVIQAVADANAASMGLDG